MDEGCQSRVRSHVDDYITKAMANYSLGRPGEEYELGNVAVFLASHESSGIIGQTIVSHCGQHL
jgi:enoyl-[acyl-carrier-protein] reductase (NADH)